MDSTAQNFVLVGAIAIAIVIVSAGFILSRRHGRWTHKIKTVIDQISEKSLQDVVIPDGSGGQIHLDYLLLTIKGLVVLDVKDVVGNVFGSNMMDNWTVIAHQDRHSFRNPQGPLYDRVAAVKSLASEVPVTGRIVFTERAEFPKGTPDHVVQLNTLLSEFDVNTLAKSGAVIEAFYPHWERVCRSIIDT